MYASGNSMKDGRRNCSWTQEESHEQAETLGATQSKIKLNRLKRSPKTSQTQKPAITNSKAEADFKTPTRVQRLGFRSSNTAESPNNDSELQHEIIWDPTSPATPVRNGRGRRRTTAFRSVEISDIVNRIAPKNKKPEEADSTLLQWIGDTAIPCTPEIREPRTKLKPARQNPVDDLLKLAKQFDFNMFQQEEAHLRQDHQSSAEAMHEDQDLFFDENDPPASLQFCSKAKRPPLGLKDTKTNRDDPSDNLGLAQEIEDDLDFLFEDSTQQLSGSLSQGFSTRSQDVVTITTQSGAKSDEVKNACDVTRMVRTSESSTASERGVAPALSTIKQVGGGADFDDDWNDDDLLDDSLVMEMTQNPELFAAPQHSSTQKQMDKSTAYRHSGGKEANYGREQQFNQRPESVQRSQHWNKAIGFDSKNNKETQAFSPCRVPSMVPGSQSVSKTNTRKPTENRQHLATTSANATWSSSLASRLDSFRSVPSTTPESTPATRINSVTKKKENNPAAEDDVLCDLAAEDLDSIFASDDIWEDGTDDDLFCEACEKVEESIAEPAPPSESSVSKPTPQRSRVQSTQNSTSKRGRGLLLSSASNAQIYERSGPWNRAPSTTNVLPGAHKNNTLALDNSMMMSSKRIHGFSHVKSTTGTGSTACNTSSQVTESAVATTGQSYQRNKKDDHQFKKPHSTFNAAASVSKDVSQAVGTRCSDAEIEKKKQQAVERRRRRMLANQNLQAPV